MEVADGRGEYAPRGAKLGDGLARAAVLRAVHVVDEQRAAGAQAVPEEGQGRGGGGVEVGVYRDEGEAAPLAAGEGVRKPALV